MFVCRVLKYFCVNKTNISWRARHGLVYCNWSLKPFSHCTCFQWCSPQGRAKDSARTTAARSKRDHIWHRLLRYTEQVVSSQVRFPAGLDVIAMEIAGFTSNEWGRDTSDACVAMLYHIFN